MAFNATIFAANYIGAYRQVELLAERRIEAAALIATQRNARRGVAELRSKMASAGLGKLGFALTSSSDAEKTGKVHRKAGGFSASGLVHYRKKVSERSRGAIEIYSQGGTISPTGASGPWLWIPTNQIPKRAGRKKMTPKLYNATGLDRRIGPLVRVTRANGYPMLIVNAVGISTSGRGRSARRATGRGLSSGRQTEASIIAFIGIPNTVRSRRINLTAHGKEMQAQLPADFLQAFKGTA